MTSENNTIRKVVQCPNCKKIHVTTGKRFFKCCGQFQDIEPNLINQTQEKTETPLSSEADTETQEGVKEFSPKTNSQNVKVKSPLSERENPSQFSNQEEDIEIEEYKEEEKEEKFHCPMCNAEVNKFEDCPNCKAILTWSEE